MGEVEKVASRLQMWHQYTRTCCLCWLAWKCIRHEQACNVMAHAQQVSESGEGRCCDLKQAQAKHAFRRC